MTVAGPNDPGDRVQRRPEKTVLKTDHQADHRTAPRPGNQADGRADHRPGRWTRHWANHRANRSGGAIGAAAGGLAGPAGLAVLITLIWVAFVTPVIHFDVDVFLRAGAAVADGRDPYPPPGTPEVYSGFAFVYPYLMSLPFVPLSALPRADDLFIALSIVALCVACRLGRAGWWTSALVLCASCTITGLQMGTFNALLLLGLVALWRLRDVPAAAGVLAAVLIYSKLFLLPVLLWLALTRRPRAALYAVATLAALFAVGEVYSPVEARTYADMLGALAREEAPDGLSLTGLLMNTGLPLAPATWAARVAGVLLIVGCLAPARRAGKAAGDALLFAGVVAAALVASPIVWSHYLVLLVAPLLALTRGVPAAPGAGRGGHPDLPPAVFTAVTWLLVTPHLSSPTDKLLAAVVLVPLIAVPLLRSAPAGRAGRPDAVAVWAALAGLLVAGVGAALWLVARAHGDDQRVIGAYGVLVGTVALLSWAIRASRPDGTATNAPAAPAAPAASATAPAASTSSPAAPASSPAAPAS